MKTTVLEALEKLLNRRLSIEDKRAVLSDFVTNVLWSIIIGRILIPEVFYNIFWSVTIVVLIDNVSLLLR